MKKRERRGLRKGRLRKTKSRKFQPFQIRQGYHSLGYL